MQIVTRSIVPHDGYAAAEIFFDAVQNGTADVYTQAQRDAWSGPAPNHARWQAHFTDIQGVAAEVDGAFAGFITRDAAGYIKFAFVKSSLANQGIGRLLYAQIENQARAEALPRLTVEASLKARPFFTKMGWQVDLEQVVDKAGVQLTNFLMSKRLTP